MEDEKNTVVLLGEEKKPALRFDHPLRIHLDHGRRATNRLHGTEHPIIRVDDPLGSPVLFSTLIRMRCSKCDGFDARFTQDGGDRAWVVLESGILIAK